MRERESKDKTDEIVIRSSLIDDCYARTTKSKLLLLLKSQSRASYEVTGYRGGGGPCNATEPPRLGVKVVRLLNGRADTDCLSGM